MSAFDPFRPLANCPRRGTMNAQRFLLILFAAPLLAASPPPTDKQSVDQSQIMQVVLDDARSRWMEVQVPCLSDTLRNRTSDQDTMDRVSRHSDVRSPFPICRGYKQVDPHFTLHEAIIEGRYALISLDFDCPLCGNGTVYQLRKTNGSWRIVSRKASWVS